MAESNDMELAADNVAQPPLKVIVQVKQSEEIHWMPWSPPTVNWHKRSI